MHPADQPGSGAPQPQPDYSFIMNPEKPPRKSWLPGGQSVIGRVLIALVGLLLIMVVFVVAKGLFGSSSDMSGFISLAQRQQEIIHLTTNAKEVEGLPENTKNFIVTADLSLANTQKDFLTYLSNNGTKVDIKVLNQTVNAQVDSELETAKGNGRYDEVFRAAVSEELNSYRQALQNTYNSTSGPKGKELLSSAFDESQLLLQLLEN